MSRKEGEILEELEVELEKIREREPVFGEELVCILRANVVEGRIKKFFDSETEDTLADYVERVIFYYKANYRYVSRLQLEDIDAWRELLEKLGKWAYSFLKKKGVPIQADLYQIATDCANEAGARLAKIQFPYDVNYDSWACRVTQYVCYSYIRRNTEKVKYVDLDITEAAEWLQALSKPDYTNRADKRMDLQSAIGCLNSEDRKRIIELYYFEGRSLSEIAEILERSMNATYKLHFDALENLRCIYQEMGSYNLPVGSP
jgi:RNA polymerase sigma factor (sigma-70 family)